MKKIALINVFIGDFPWFFDYFLKSCAYNPTVDFYIFCNKKHNNPMPRNVKLIDLTLSGFNTLASHQLGMTISVENAYKLCDFKPAYGVIFSEFLKEYDFWGICDIDIIFGQIREFMTETILSNYKVISVRHDFPTGYFMLFKNKREINYLFTKSKDYRMVFQSQEHFCFDECNFKHREVIAGANILEIPSKIESMHHILVKERGNLKVFWDFLIIEGHPGHLIWDNGRLTFKKNYEILLYHLRIFKTNVLVQKKSPSRIAKKIKIHGYHIQNASLNFLKNFYDYLKFEQINPFLHRFLPLIDFFFSSLIHLSSQRKSQNESLFSDGFIYLKRNQTNYVSVAFAKGPLKYEPIIPSYFIKNRYYTKSDTIQKYLIRPINESKVDFQIINEIGNVSKAQLDFEN